MSRSLVALACMLAMLAGPLAQAAEEPVPRVVSIDWGLSATLLALGDDLLAIAEKPSYLDWVGEPQPAAATPDLGLRLAPDMEVLQSVAPDLILITPQFASIEARLATIAPVRSFAIFTPDKQPLVHARTVTRELGTLLKRSTAAEQLIAKTSQAISALKAQKAGAPDTCPLLVVSFVGDGHVRIFGKGSLYDAVLEEAGIKSGWTGNTNYWGFTTVPLSTLLNFPNAGLVVIEPMPIEIRRTLENQDDASAKGGILANLPAVRQNRYITLRPIWAFGGMVEATAFAESLEASTLPECRHDKT